MRKYNGIKPDNFYWFLKECEWRLNRGNHADLPKQLKSWYKYDLTFLFHCLSSLQLTRLAKGVKPGINRNDVYELEFSFPPLPEQKRIAAALERVSATTRRLEVLYQQKLDALNELKQSILQKAFSGDLTKAENAAGLIYGNFGTRATFPSVSFKADAVASGISGNPDPDFDDSVEERCLY